MTPPDTSKLRNAVRDLAKTMQRFDRDYARWQREARALRDAGTSDTDLMAIVNEAVRGHPELARKLNDFMTRMAEVVDA